METCKNCEYYNSKEGTCNNGKLEDMIYPNMEMSDDSGLYLVSFDVEPNFGCILFIKQEG